MRPDFSQIWAGDRLSITPIVDNDYRSGFDAYLGQNPPTADDHDYIMNLQDKRAAWLGEQMLLAVGHEWQADVTYDQYAIVRSAVNGKLYSSLVAANLGDEPSVSPAAWRIFDPQSAWANDIGVTGEINVAPRVRWLADSSFTLGRTIGPDVTDLVVKDIGGNASANNITITAPAGKTINGDTFEVIDVDNGWVQYALVGTDFKTVGGN